MFNWFFPNILRKFTTNQRGKHLQVTSGAHKKIKEEEYTTTRKTRSYGTSPMDRAENYIKYNIEVKPLNLFYANKNKFLFDTKSLYLLFTLMGFTTDQIIKIIAAPEKSFLFMCASDEVLKDLLEFSKNKYIPQETLTDLRVDKHILLTGIIYQFLADAATKNPVDVSSKAYAELTKAKNTQYYNDIKDTAELIARLTDGSSAVLGAMYDDLSSAKFFKETDDIKFFKSAINSAKRLENTLPATEIRNAITENIKSLINEQIKKAFDLRYNKILNDLTLNALRYRKKESDSVVSGDMRVNESEDDSTTILDLVAAPEQISHLDDDHILRNEKVAKNIYSSLLNLIYPYTEPDAIEKRKQSMMYFNSAITDQVKDLLKARKIIVKNPEVVTQIANIGDPKDLYNKAADEYRMDEKNSVRNPFIGSGFKLFANVEDMTLHDVLQYTRVIKQIIPILKNEESWAHTPKTDKPHVIYPSRTNIANIRDYVTYHREELANASGIKSQLTEIKDDITKIDNTVTQENYIFVGVDYVQHYIDSLIKNGDTEATLDKLPSVLYNLKDNNKSVLKAAGISEKELNDLAHKAEMLEFMRSFFDPENYLDALNKFVAFSEEISQLVNDDDESLKKVIDILQEAKKSGDKAYRENYLNNNSACEEVSQKALQSVMKNADYAKEVLKDVLSSANTASKDERANSIKEEVKEKLSKILSVSGISRDLKRKVENISNHVSYEEYDSAIEGIEYLLESQINRDDIQESKPLFMEHINKTDKELINNCLLNVKTSVLELAGLMRGKNLIKYTGTDTIDDAISAVYDIVDATSTESAKEIIKLSYKNVHAEVSTGTSYSLTNAKLVILKQVLTNCGTLITSLNTAILENKDTEAEQTNSNDDGDKNENSNTENNKERATRLIEDLSNIFIDAGASKYIVSFFIKTPNLCFNTFVYDILEMTMRDKNYKKTGTLLNNLYSWISSANDFITEFFEDKYKKENPQKESTDQDEDTDEEIVESDEDKYYAKMYAFIDSTMQQFSDGISTFAYNPSFSVKIDSNLGSLSDVIDQCYKFFITGRDDNNFVKYLYYKLVKLPAAGVAKSKHEKDIRKFCNEYEMKNRKDLLVSLVSTMSDGFDAEPMTVVWYRDGKIPEKIYNAVFLPGIGNYFKTFLPTDDNKEGEEKIKSYRSLTPIKGPVFSEGSYKLNTGVNSYVIDDRSQKAYQVLRSVGTYELNPIPVDVSELNEEYPTGNTVVQIHDIFKLTPNSLQISNKDPQEEYTAFLRDRELRNLEDTVGKLGIENYYGGAEDLSDTELEALANSLGKLAKENSDNISELIKLVYLVTSRVRPEFVSNKKVSSKVTSILEDIRILVNEKCTEATSPFDNIYVLCDIIFSSSRKLTKQTASILSDALNDALERLIEYAKNVNSGKDADEENLPKLTSKYAAIHDELKDAVSILDYKIGGDALRAALSDIDSAWKFSGSKNSNTLDAFALKKDMSDEDVKTLTEIVSAMAAEKEGSLSDLVSVVYLVTGKLPQSVRDSISNQINSILEKIKEHILLECNEGSNPFEKIAILCKNVLRFSNKLTEQTSSLFADVLSDSLKELEAYANKLESGKEESDLNLNLRLSEVHDALKEATGLIDEKCPTKDATGMLRELDAKWDFLKDSDFAATVDNYVSRKIDRGSLSDKEYNNLAGAIYNETKKCSGNLEDLVSLVYKITGKLGEEVISTSIVSEKLQIILNKIRELVNSQIGGKSEDIFKSTANLCSLISDFENKLTVKTANVFSEILENRIQDISFDKNAIFDRGQSTYEINRKYAAIHDSLARAVDILSNHGATNAKSWLDSVDRVWKKYDTINKDKYDQSGKIFRKKRRKPKKIVNDESVDTTNETVTPNSAEKDGVSEISDTNPEAGNDKKIEPSASAAFVHFHKVAGPFFIVNASEFNPTDLELRKELETPMAGGSPTEKKVVTDTEQLGASSIDEDTTSTRSFSTKSVVKALKMAYTRDKKFFDDLVQTIGDSSPDVGEATATVMRLLPYNNWVFEQALRAYNLKNPQQQKHRRSIQLCLEEHGWPQLIKNNKFVKLLDEYNNGGSK